MLKRLAIATVASFAVIWIGNNVAPVTAIYNTLKLNK